MTIEAGYPRFPRIVINCTYWDLEEGAQKGLLGLIEVPKVLLGSEDLLGSSAQNSS